MRSLGLALILVGLVVLPCLQDAPAGPPVALDLKLSDAPTPWYVAGRPGLLKIVAVDAFGRPSPVNGDSVVLKTTDRRSRLTGLQVPLVNGMALVRAQFFTIGEHAITASSKTGLAGRVGGILIRDLPASLKFEVEKPNPAPRYAWSGGVWKLKGKLTADGKPVWGVQVSLKTSRGLRSWPHALFTDDDLGTFECDIFTLFVCPENGGGPIDGDAPIDLDCFVDANGNGQVDQGEVVDDMPPSGVVEPCPQESIPCALEILRILEGGGSLEPPADGGIIVTAAATPRGKAVSDLAKIRDARRFLENQVIDFVNSGKWDGKFSVVR